MKDGLSLFCCRWPQDIVTPLKLPTLLEIEIVFLLNCPHTTQIVVPLAFCLDPDGYSIPTSFLKAPIVCLEPYRAHLG